MVAAVADEWMKSAMTNGGMVAEMLLSLKDAKVTPLVFENPTVAALRWGIRQPRSRSPSCNVVSQSQRKEVESARNSRCSPSTPLSWSGGCGGGSSSPSVYADGCEATSRQTSCSFAFGSRSKILIAEDSAGSGSSSSTKTMKKTFAEVKEEEDNLLQERICLKKEIASLQAKFEDQDAENMKLKRMKLDQENIHQRQDKHHWKTEEEEEEDKKNNFVIPDLNVMPLEDNSDQRDIV